jgi:hypothetical protein
VFSNFLGHALTWVWVPSVNNKPATTP